MTSQAVLRGDTLIPKGATTEDLDRILGVVHHFLPHLYLKRMYIAAGSIVGTHKHTFDHMSVLAKGSVAVETDGILAMYRAPAYVMIKAGVEHRIMAMEDSVWYCTHVTDETNPDKIDETLIRS